MNAINKTIDEIAELESQKRVLDSKLKELREALKEDALSNGLSEIDTGYATMRLIPRSKLVVANEAQLMGYLKDEGIIFEFVKLDISSKKLSDVRKLDSVTASQIEEIKEYLAEEFEVALKIDINKE